MTASSFVPHSRSPSCARSSDAIASSSPPAWMCAKPPHRLAPMAPRISPTARACNA
jgi:hypothetical protein